MVKLNITEKKALTIINGSGQEIKKISITFVQVHALEFALTSNNFLELMFQCKKLARV